MTVEELAHSLAGVKGEARKLPVKIQTIDAMTFDDVSHVGVWDDGTFLTSTRWTTPKQPKTCEKCNGTGWQSQATATPCPVCRGLGILDG